MERYQAAILDADFAIRVGQTEVINVIGELLPQFCTTLYVHRYVFENEILFPPLVRQRITALIEAGLAAIVDREYIERQGDSLAAAVYDETVQLLGSVDPDTKVRGKNWGEVVSLALAKAMNIPVFLSDESGAQSLVDEYLNLSEEMPEAAGNILVVRVRDFVAWMRDKGLPRKQGRVLWIAAGKPRDGFDRIWPPGTPAKR